MTNAFLSEVYVNHGAIVSVTSASSYKAETPEQVEARIFQVAQRTRASSLSGPVKRGACLGPLVIDAGQDGEVFTLSFTSLTVKDLTVSIDMNSVVAESDGGLLTRRAANGSALASLNFRSTVLRKGALTIGGRPAEELLESGKDHDKRVLGFYGETLLKTPSRFDAPQIAIEMKMGGQVSGPDSGHDYVDASLNDKDALALWDAVVRSIRLRPGAV